jgi:hypothetical protein
MRTPLLTTLLAFTLCGTLAAERATAQYRRPGGPGGIRLPSRQPAYSPYLNLLRPGSVTQNYLGLVRPQMEFRGAYQQLGQAVAANQGQIASLASGAGPTTGHPASFLNTGGYFLSNGGAGPARPARGGVGGGQVGAGRSGIGRAGSAQGGGRGGSGRSSGRGGSRRR